MFAGEQRCRLAPGHLGKHRGSTREWEEAATAAEWLAQAEAQGGHDWTILGGRSKRIRPEGPGPSEREK